MRTPSLRQAGLLIPSHPISCSKDNFVESNDTGFQDRGGPHDSAMIRRTRTVNSVRPRYGGNSQRCTTIDHSFVHVCKQPVRGMTTRNQLLLFACGLLVLTYVDRLALSQPQPHRGPAEDFYPNFMPVSSPSGTRPRDRLVLFYPWASIPHTSQEWLNQCFFH